MDYTLHEWVRMASHHESIARCAIEKQTEIGRASCRERV